jgi:hypothetical protein
MHATDYHQLARQRHRDLLREAQQERLGAIARASGREPGEVRFLRTRAVAARLARLGTQPRPATHGA